MGWTQGVFENDGAQSFPTFQPGSNHSYDEGYTIVLSNHKYWLVVQPPFAGQNDPWLDGDFICIGPNVYVKTFYDEIGT